MTSAPAATAAHGSFTYANPPVIHWGPGCLAERLDAELRRLNAQRVFLITTRSVGGNPALAGSLEKQLGGRLVGSYAAIGEHAPVRSIVEAVEAARVAQPDALISFGGGSPIDAAKTVAFALASDLDLSNPDAPSAARGISLSGKPVLPHLAIPTTLSAAELSAMAGFSSEGEREKVGLGAPELASAVVFYDADLSLHTPQKLWLSSGIRGVDHAVESMLGPLSNPFSDTMSLEALRRLKASLLATKADPSDLAARTESQLGTWFSYTLPLESARGLSHSLGKRLGSRHGIPHGITSCLLLPHVMRYLAPRTAPAQARMAEALGVDITGLDDRQAAAAAADAVAALIASLDLPSHLSAYGLSEDDLQEAVGPLAGARHTQDDLLAILRAAW